MRESGLFRNLSRFFGRFTENSVAASLQSRFLSALENIKNHKSICGEIGGLRFIYENAIRIVEHEAAASCFKEDPLLLQKALYVELEYLLSFGNHDPRHHFLVVIPVADRPQMLRNCLQSIMEQCRVFQYGGFSISEDGLPVYNKISVFILDDSREDASKKMIKALSSEMQSSGIRTYYIGPKEQGEVLKRLPGEYREKLSGLIGSFGDTVPPHKGASISRNIAYLYLRSFLTGFKEKPLIYFLDSDEEFRIRTVSGDMTEDIAFINYFYWIDRIFEKADIEVLTGKVVGDPPVSSSVMLSTFLGDLKAFFDMISGHQADEDCICHGAVHASKFSAEYHDMVGLFGYQSPTSPRAYSCSLSGSHTMEECFRAFSRIIAGFFFGMHPTRMQFYNHAMDVTITEDARTVYTGNYIFTADGLRHFIPFASLKLRMAGPTLGRILNERIGSRFVSANLPLLHKRTVPGSSGEEFRSGVSADQGSIDLSGEFFNQFWGDVMLFSIERLAQSGYPDRVVTLQEITEIVHEVRNTVWDLYRKQQDEISRKISEIRHYLSGPEYWWNAYAGMEEAADSFRTFCSTVESNFGTASTSMKNLTVQVNDGSSAEMIIRAIHAFYGDEYYWKELLKTDPPWYQFCKEVRDITASE